MTQEKLAELAELHLRSLQKIEAGEINLLLTTVLRIKRALKCPWTKLLE
jgi:DNA-binding XRE family transcriptional regulator